MKINYLLKEDSTLDKLDVEYKILRNKVKNLGSGPEGAESLSSKYNGTPKEQIPIHHRTKINDYRKAVEDFSEISSKRTKYAEWIKNGKRGPKPGSGGFGSNPFGSGRYRTNSNYEEFYQNLRKRQALQRKVAIISWAVYLSILLTFSYVQYKQAKRDEELRTRASKLKGKNKDISIIRSRIIGKKKQILILKNGVVKCEKTDNPQKCKKAISLKIKILQEEIFDLTEKLKSGSKT